MKQRDKQTDVFYTLLILILVVLAMWMLGSCSQDKSDATCQCELIYTREYYQDVTATKLLREDIDRPAIVLNCDLESTDGYERYSDATLENGQYVIFKRKITCE